MREEEERGGRGGKNIKSVRNHGGISVSGCRRSDKTLSIQRSQSLHAENKKTCLGFFPPRRNSQDKKRKKKRIKICRRKCQWKMYSPSGSKRFSNKKKLGVWRCWTGAVQAAKYRGSASPPRSVSLPVLESCDSGFGQSF